MRASSLAAVLILCTQSSVAFGDTIAYEVPAGTVGTQTFNGSLGMDFDVVSDIEITRLGVFDSGSDGLTLPLRAHIYDRTKTDEPFVTLNFAPGSGTLVDGSRFLDLKSQSIVLPAGFQGTIVGEGFGVGEPNGNLGTGSVLGTTNDAGGLINFVGSARFGTNNLYPGSPDGGPANRYHSGTFEFQAATKPAGAVLGGISYVVPEGTVGNQAFGGSLGMDFNVTQDIVIQDLGVFDSGSDGLATTITAHVYDRNNPGAPLATLQFTPGDPGTLIDGSRFKSLDTPLELLAGFEGTIVAEGYNAAEPNGNSSGQVPLWSADTYGVIDFVGSGRFGTAGLFPGSPDGGPANRYAAGTFRFATPAGLAAVPEPSAVFVWVALGSLLGLVRRKRLSLRG